MAYTFDEAYYLKVKLAQMESVDARDMDGNAYTEASLREALTQKGITLQEHYEAFGRAEGLNPNPYFNETEYVLALTRQLNSLGEKDARGNSFTPASVRKAIADEGMIPAEHYERVGAYATDAQGCYVNPSNAFDVNAYFAAKLLQVWSTNEVVNGNSGTDIPMADLLEIMASSGMSPVTHYMAFGAAEATAAGMPMVQTVPAPQRVPNDPKRLSVAREIVPANYNPATPAPARVFIPFPPPKPADVGNLVPESVSPEPVPPAYPVPAPGEIGYVAPPPGWADTTSQPMVPSSVPSPGASALPGVENAVHWVSVDTFNNSGIVLKADGTVAAQLPPGSVHLDPTGSYVLPDMVADVLPAAAIAGYFAATVEAENVQFSDGMTDIFVTHFGSEGLREQQSVDLGEVTLESGQELVIKTSESTVRISNDTNAALSGENLAAFASQAAPEDWQVSRDGSVLTFTANTAGEKDDISVAYTADVAEVQSVTLEGITFESGDTLYVGSEILYTHSGGAVSGGDLAEIIAADGALSGWRLEHQGTKLVFTAEQKAVDLATLDIHVGSSSLWLDVQEEIKGAADVLFSLNVAEEIQGACGTLSGSSLMNLDAISGFNWREDKIALPDKVVEFIKGESLEDATASAIAAVVGSGEGQVNAGQAGLFKFAKDYYLVVNDADATFSATADIVIKLTGLSDADAAAMTPDIFITGV